MKIMFCPKCGSRKIATAPQVRGHMRLGYTHSYHCCGVEYLRYDHRDVGGCEWYSRLYRDPDDPWKYAYPFILKDPMVTYWDGV